MYEMIDLDKNVINGVLLIPESTPRRQVQRRMFNCNLPSMLELMDLLIGPSEP